MGEELQEQEKHSLSLFISNEYLDDIIKIENSLENSGLLIDGANETVKYETKTQEGGFVGAIITPISASMIASMDSSLIQPAASLFINAMSGKGAIRVGKKLLALPMLMKVLGKRTTRVGKRLTRTRKKYQGSYK